MKGFQPLHKTSSPGPSSFRSTLHSGKIYPFLSLSQVHHFSLLFYVFSKGLHNLEPIMLLYFKKTNSINVHKFSLFAWKCLWTKESQALHFQKGFKKLVHVSENFSAHFMEIAADDPQQLTKSITIMRKCLFCCQTLCKGDQTCLIKNPISPHHQHLPGHYYIL